MEQGIVRPVGVVRRQGQRVYIDLEPQYIPALRGLEEYSHLYLLWWFDGCDDEQSRNRLQVGTPHANAPELLGAFATRTPHRPNPIALDVAAIRWIDHRIGRICVDHTDARDGTPALDVKPYTPGDRVVKLCSPSWLASGAAAR